jgi:hypothetical protein
MPAASSYVPPTMNQPSSSSITAPAADAKNHLGGAQTSMSRYRVSSTARITAPPALVYGVIADYRRHHSHIIPPTYFRRLEVLEGGVGAGTRTRVEMRVLGTTRVFEQEISEPEPGRVLVETNQDGLAVTSFTVRRAGPGGAARVTISTDIMARSGLSGFLERLFTSVMLRRIYREELARLTEYVAQLQSPGQSRPPTKSASGG